MLLSGPNNETLSNNWSGYGINGGGTYTAVQGSWTVPAVSYQSYSGSPDVEASSTWIGVGGQDGDETLIQIGTMQAAAPNGETEYFAWYEVLPDDRGSDQSQTISGQAGRHDHRHDPMHGGMRALRAIDLGPHVDQCRAAGRSRTR